MDYLEPVSKEQLKAIYDEFGATEESLKNDVNILMKWLEKQPHLPNAKDTQWLTHFLICCKNSIERAKQKLDAYFTARAQSPIVLTTRKDIMKPVDIYKNIMIFIPMPKLTHDGARVFIWRVFGQTDSKFSMTSELMVQYAQLNLDMNMKLDSVSKYIMIFDMENVTLHLVAVIFPVMKKLVDLVTKNNPMRIQKFYAMNVASAVEPLVNFSISLLSKKMASRTVVWKKKSKELIEVIDERVLPPLYGGTEQPLEVLREKYVECAKALVDWMDSTEDYRADLSKKPSADGVTTEIGDYGVEGTFRKINLD